MATSSVGPSTFVTPSPTQPNPSACMEGEEERSFALPTRRFLSPTSAPLGSHLMLGCAGIGGIYHRHCNKEIAVKLIRRAVIDHGIRAIDTAPWYGCGKSELDLRAAIESIAKTHPSIVRRDHNGGDNDNRQVAIYTKVGRVTLDRASLLSSPERLGELAAQLHVAPASFVARCTEALTRDTCYAIHKETEDLVCVEAATAAGIKESWASSSERLGPLAASLVHTLRLHDADTDSLIAEAIDPHHGAFTALHTVGPNKRNGCSLGLNDPMVALRFLTSAPSLQPCEAHQRYFSSVMIAGCWNLIDQSALPLLVECQSRGVAVHLGGIFAAGFLWGGECYRYAALPPGEAGLCLLARRSEWAALAEKYHVSLPCVALQFALVPLCVEYAAIGCSSVEELDACVQLLQEFLPHDTFMQLLRDAATRKLVDPDVAVVLHLLGDNA